MFQSKQPELGVDVDNQSLMQSSNVAPSNSSSQIINIDTFNVNTDENNAKAIVNNSIGDADIIRMSGSSAMSFMHNIG